MGNYIIYKCRKGSCTGTTAGVRQKVVEVVKTDGEILEFTTSILVKELLENYPGFGVGLEVSRKRTSDCLPLCYDLKPGNVYFLYPVDQKENLAAGLSLSVSQSPPLQTERTGPGVNKTIKVVISKRQLQDIISDKISFDSVLQGIKSKACSAESSSPKHWQPKLESISE